MALYGIFLMSLDGHCVAGISSKTTAFPSKHTHPHTQNKRNEGEDWALGEASWHDCGLNRQGVARAVSIMGGIKAGSLKRNKSEWERTQGPGSYLALCQALTALDVFRRGSWTQHLDHVYLLTPFSSANSSGSILGGDRLFLFYFFCLILSSNTPLTPRPPAFVHVSRLQPLFLLSSMEREQAC